MSDFDPKLRKAGQFGVSKPRQLQQYLFRPFAEGFRPQIGIVALDAPSDKYTYGLDLSRYNKVDFSKLKAGGYYYVILKASEGSSWVDPKFDEFYKAALSEGLYVMAYHFFRDYNTSTDQGSHFLTTVDGLLNATDGKTRLFIDVEANNGISQSLRSQRLLNLGNYIKDRQKVPGFYSSYYLWNSLVGNVSWISNFYQWVAHWTPASEPLLPPGWTVDKTLFWQFGIYPTYSWTPSVPGAESAVDVDRFYGGVDDLKDFLGFQDVPPQPPSDLEARVADLEGRMDSAEKRLDALENPEVVTYQIVDTKSLANEQYGTNAAGKALMKIWEGSVSNGFNRIRFDQGEKVECLPVFIEGDGGKTWVQLRTQDISQSLYLELSKMVQV